MGSCLGHGAAFQRSANVEYTHFIVAVVYMLYAQPRVDKEMQRNTKLDKKSIGDI